MTSEPSPAAPAASPTPPAPVVTDAGAAPAAAAMAAPPAAPAAPPHPAAPRLHGASHGLWLAWLLAAVGLVLSLMLWQKLGGMQEQLARQSSDAGTQSVEARTLARQAEEGVRDMAGKVAALDARVAELAAYRAQLDELVHSVTRARDENLAVELEAALRLAQDQTQLTGSVEPLLAALRTAERRLARSSDPRLAPVGRAVARDLERVKAASLPDAAGLLARLDQLLRQVDDLPAGNDVHPARGAPGARGRPGRHHRQLVGPPVAGRARRGAGPAARQPRRAPRSQHDEPGAGVLRAREPQAAPAGRAPGAAGAPVRGRARRPVGRRQRAGHLVRPGVAPHPGRRHLAAANPGQHPAAELPRVDETLVALGHAVASAGAVSGAR
jgi:uroporphyrin-3 C-methyltransferase